MIFKTHGRGSVNMILFLISSHLFSLVFVLLFVYNPKNLMISLGGDFCFGVLLNTTTVWFQGQIRMKFMQNMLGLVVGTVRSRSALNFSTNS